MAKREFHSIEDMGGPHLLTVGGEVQQPGTIVQGDGMQEHNIYHEKLPQGAMGSALGSDKFAVLTFMLDAVMAYQLLPVDPYRKIARLSVPLNQPNFPQGVGPTLSIPNPASGSNSSYNVGWPFGGGQYSGSGYPYRYPWTLNFCQFTVVTGAAAGNREAAVVYGGVTYTANYLQPPSTTVTYLFAVGATPMTAPAANNLLSTPVPANAQSSYPGTLQQQVLGIQAGDQISAITYSAQAVNTPTPAIVIGDEATIDSGTYALNTTGNRPTPVVPTGYVLPMGTLHYEFTSKGALYGAAVGNMSQALALQVCIMVERFQKGTPVT